MPIGKPAANLDRYKIYGDRFLNRDGALIATCASPADADALAIICNEHDALVQALTDARNMVETMTGGAEIDAAVARFDAVIARAKGGPS